MKHLSAAFVLFVFCAASLTGQDISKRAAEIAPFLPEKPWSIGKPVTDRNAWEAVPKGDFIREAEKLAATPIPDLPEELYKEYYRNGNRINYQRVYHARHRRMTLFPLAECLENKGRFIKPFEEYVRSLCADRSWLVPAHDRRNNAPGEVYDGKSVYIDLYSSNLTAELALADAFLGDKLSPEIRKMLRENIERRTFQTYENSVKTGKAHGNGWIAGTSNWNTVCHANVVCAALTLIDDPQRRAWYIASAEKYMKPFFSGFAADGYCTEGIGYWGYGFGHFIYLAETVYQATGGKVDFFAMPKVAVCAAFAPKMEAAPNQFAAFADCFHAARPDPALLKFLNRRMQWGYNDYDTFQYVPETLKTTAVLCFPNSADKMPLAASKGSPLNDLRSEFPEAGLMIFRPKRGTGGGTGGLTPPAREDVARKDVARKDIAAVFKAGNNADHHNHNDVGSYTVMYAGTVPVLDPGGEIYTARTFSSKRYESKLLSSFGHPVPVINGKLQKTGHDAAGKIVMKSLTDAKDTCTMEYAAAYGLPEIKKLERTFEFTRPADVPNSFTVSDTIELEPAGTVETALITYEPWKREESAEDVKLLLGKEGKQVIVRVAAAVDGKPAALTFAATEIDEDAVAGKKPVRFAFAVKEPVKNVKITTTIKPQ